MVTSPVSGSTSSSQTWQPFGKVGGAFDEPLASSPAPNLVVGPTGRKNAFATPTSAMPRASDLPPHYELDFIDVPAKTNPLGVKGIGEAGCVGAPPAVMNALLDALRPRGVRHLDMPATPRRVWEALRNSDPGS